MSTAPLGYLAVDVPIPRPLGDAWNEQTWPFPLIREEIEGSQLENILTSDGYPPEFEDKIVEAGQRLIAKGCIGLITDCGFIAIAQPNLARRLSVPIAASALVQIPSILAILPPNQSVGVLTYDATKLGPLHLQRVGIHDTSRVHIAGAPEKGELKAMVRDKAPYSHHGIEKELIRCASELIAQHPDIGTILLECTQMPPFAEAVQRAVKLPVHDIYSMGLWFYSGLCHRTPDAWKI